MSTQFAVLKHRVLSPVSFLFLLALLQPSLKDHRHTERSRRQRLLQRLREEGLLIHPILALSDAWLHFRFCAQL